MKVIPLTLRQANAFVAEHHRHSKPVVGARFSIGAEHNGELVGVAIIGRPVSRRIDHTRIAELTRNCVSADAPRNTCSFLYGRAWRIWQQMGGEQMITYTLKKESGASLSGAGWKVLGEVKVNTDGWNSKTRQRQNAAIYQKKKFKWGAENERA